MNSEALTGRIAGIHRTPPRGPRPPDLRFRVTSCGRYSPIPSPEEEEVVDAEGERRLLLLLLLLMAAMPAGREEEEVKAEDAAARVGAARGTFMGEMGGRAENRRRGRGAKWQASSEMGAGGEPAPDGAMPRARGRGQPRGRKVAGAGWEARGGRSWRFFRMGIPRGVRGEWLAPL